MTSEEFGAWTVRCCEAAWTDRLGERHSIVVAPRDHEDAKGYATRRFQSVVCPVSDSSFQLWYNEWNPDDPNVRRRDEERRKAEKELEALHLTLSASVSMTMSPEEAGACADAVDSVLAVVGSTDAEWAAAEVRAGRWWNAPLAERMRERARGRYRKAMDTAVQQYAEAVGDVPARVRAEVVRAERAAQERQREIEAEATRQRAARQQVIATVDNRRVWQLLVEGTTAYVKRSDIPPTAALPPADRPWSEPLEPYPLALRIAGLLYQRLMVPPKIRELVFDDAAVDAVGRELSAGGVRPSTWWDDHARRAAEWKSEFEMRHRRGG